MQNNLKVLALLTGIAFSGAALAETASEQLTRIEAETLLLKAREKQLEVQANIVARQNEIATKRQLTDQLAQTAVAGDPVVRSIEGIGKVMYATVQLADGNLVDARVGDVLPNGMKVASIKPHEVIVENRKKRRVRLMNGTQAFNVATAFNPAYPSPAVNIPLPMPAPAAMRGSAR